MEEMAAGSKYRAGGAMELGRRSTAPVFVVGSGRCGTKYLYHSLLSAGGFAICHSESNAFNVLGLRFGNLAIRRNRRRLLKTYLASKLFQQSGLDGNDIAERVMEDCHNTGDFLRILMEAIAHKQGTRRWAESTPLHLLYLPLIKKEIPNALFVHIIRDGRDVAASAHRAGLFRMLPWNHSRAFLAGAIYWRWVVTKGRRYGQAIGQDYMEVHYEDLVLKPRETLARIGRFIEHDLDYERIQQIALGTIRNPNSSFRGDGLEVEAHTIGRWRRMFTPAQIREIESSLGSLLVDTGYVLHTPLAQLGRPLPVSFMNMLYRWFLEAKLWLKSHTPLARVSDKSCFCLGKLGVKSAIQVTAK
jgi:hypothetical protein